MLVLVGLGNPGLKYASTRHNAGFLFLDYLFDQVAKAKDSGQNPLYSFVDINIQRHKLRLIKPLTYMNLSGGAVKKVLADAGITTNIKETLLVIHDDVDLMPGQVKIKNNGGDAGHRGIRDIMSVLSSGDFIRVRIGVGRPGEEHKHKDTADYVLDNFTASEKEILIKDSFPRVYRFLKEFLTIGYEKAVSRLSLDLPT